MINNQKLQEIIEKNNGQIIDYRRQFHQNPELSFEEFETSGYIAEKLSAMGYQVKTKIGGTGVLAVLDTGKPGYLSATDDEFYIKVHGRGAHSSEPQLGTNAIVIAAQIVNGLMTILGSNVSPYDIATFSIWKITGGEAINVIPDYVEFSGMIRCVEEQNKRIIREKMKAIAESTASAMGGKADGVIILERPHLGSEDFAYYQKEIPGAIFMLGCSNPNCESGSLHNGNLNIDENSFAYGVGTFGNIALKICGKK